MAKVEQKQPIVAEISEAIKDAASIVLVTYSGITVEQDTAMRKELREAGVSYKVYKNTMMNFAFKGTPCEELCKHLEGPNAIAISKDDATAPASPEKLTPTPIPPCISGIIFFSFSKICLLKLPKSVISFTNKLLRRHFLCFYKKIRYSGFHI